MSWTAKTNKWMVRSHLAVRMRECISGPKLVEAFMSWRFAVKNLPEVSRPTDWTEYPNPTVSPLDPVLNKLRNKNPENTAKTPLLLMITSMLFLSIIFGERERESNALPFSTLPWLYASIPILIPMHVAFYSGSHSRQINQ